MTCTATVTDTDSGTQSSPAGSVAISSDGAGAFTPATTCTLNAAGSNASRCTLTYEPSASGAQHLTASFGPTTVDASSSAVTPLTVTDKTATAVACSPSAATLQRR